MGRQIMGVSRIEYSRQRDDSAKALRQGLLTVFEDHLWLEQRRNGRN
jgi:hypothetical protein